MILSLKTRASIFIALIIITISLVSSFLYISAQSRSIEKEIIARGAALSLALQKAAEEGLVQENLGFIKKASYVVQADDVEIAQVFTPLWQAMDAYPDNKFEEPPDPEAIIHFENNDTQFIKKSKSRYDFYCLVKVKPFAESPAINTGFARLALSTKAMRNAVEKAVLNNVIFSIIITLFTIFVFNKLIERLIINPVVNLHNSVKMFKSGKLPKEEPQRKNDEIGELVTEFHQMSLAIKDREESLQLERDKVAEKNKQLIEAQEELVRKEKLAILGQLAGSVSHELRNPLGVINNSLYILKSVIHNPDKKILEYLNIIKNEVDTSQRIISDLLDFSRSKTPQRSLISVEELINQSLSGCSIPDNILLRIDIPATLPPINIDPLQIRQVFQNLITNGAQAMNKKGGELTITAKQETNTGFIEIMVTDTGEGITTENMKKLFQPLFTTKARGIGLGLTVSKTYAEANGGRIEVTSIPDEGTTFTVLLPVI